MAEQQRVISPVPPASRKDARRRPSTDELSDSNPNKIPKMKTNLNALHDAIEHLEKIERTHGSEEAKTISRGGILAAPAWLLAVERAEEARERASRAAEAMTGNWRPSAAKLTVPTAAHAVVEGADRLFPSNDRFAAEASPQAQQAALAEADARIACRIRDPPRDAGECLRTIDKTSVSILSRKMYSRCNATTWIEQESTNEVANRCGEYCHCTSIVCFLFARPDCIGLLCQHPGKVVARPSLCRRRLSVSQRRFVCLRTFFKSLKLGLCAPD